MIKSELIQKIAEANPHLFQRDVERIVGTVFEEIIEAMAQTAGAICVRKQAATTPSIVYFMTIDEAKFRKPVVPGDRLELHVKKLKQRSTIWRFACEAFVDGAKVAEAQISAMIAPANI